MLSKSEFKQFSEGMKGINGKLYALDYPGSQKFSKKIYLSTNYPNNSFNMIDLVYVSDDKTDKSL